MKLTFTLEGRPVAKQRPRRVETRDGRHITYTPKETRRFESRVRAAAYVEAHRQGWPCEYAGDVAVTIRLTFPDRRHGDADNYAKAILDGLQGRGGAIRDDKQVRALKVRYGYEGEPGARIELAAMEGE